MKVDTSAKSLNSIGIFAAVILFAAAGNAAGVTWTGATDADWATASNWDGGVPQAGDSVTIPSGVENMPILSAETPALAAVSVSGTLTFTNWTTRLNATTVTVADGGVLTCAGPFTDSEMSNRVWVACTDFTLESGGQVDVTDKGYGLPVTAGLGAGVGYGPGVATGNTYGGAHGGFGGGRFTGSGTIYGSAEEPTAPGSTGKSKNGSSYAKGIPAGGAVRIDATGTVTINGTITANGHDSSSNNNCGGASGGSVLIYSRKIVASGGSISADGGSQGDYTFMRPGGGGRIALHYDTSVQSADDLVSLAVSASAGLLASGWGPKYYKFATMPDDQAADIGTVWFQDDKPLKFLGTSLTGQIYLGSGASYSCDSIAMTSGWVRFAQEGFALSVSGDVTVDGENARFEMGGGTYRRSTFAGHRSGTAAWTFTVGGNLTLSGGSRSELFAAYSESDSEACGGTLAVAGDFVVDEGSTLYLSSDPVYGNAPLVTAKNVTVGSDSTVSAEMRGFAVTYGPGKGYTSDGSAYKTANANKTIGAGHGGAGNNASSTYGIVYDDEVRPCLAGSGGRLAYDTTAPLNGGGLVHIVAEKSMTINGKISADAYATASAESFARFACGAGGTVLLECKTFAMGADAAVSADGGSLTQATFYNGGAGGGGRIAVYTGSQYVEGETKDSRLTVTAVKPESYLGSFSATGGYFKDSDGYGRKFVAAGETIGVVIEDGAEVDYGDAVAEADTWYVCPLSAATVRGGDGTIRFVTVASAGGLLITFQ